MNLELPPGKTWNLTGVTPSLDFLRKEATLPKEVVLL